MGFKKRSKVSAEFSMSSLTDIIFLLLIFFMLTSSLVSPNSLNLKFPGKSKKQTVTKKSEITDVKINRSGVYFVNGDKTSASKIERRLARLKKKTITISPDANAPIEKVATIMDIAMRYNINAILAAEK